PDGPVLHGGAGGPGRGVVLHSDDWGGEGTIQGSGLGALTGTIDVLKAIAEGRGPSRYLIALGYAGWGEGQLDEEMTRPGWFAADGRQEILFETPTAERWVATFKAEGIDPRLLDRGAGAAGSIWSGVLPAGRGKPVRPTASARREVRTGCGPRLRSDSPVLF